LKHGPTKFSSNTPGALDVAQELASQGLPCFPCANSKRPTCPRGFHDATCNPERLRALWRQYPGVLVGVSTGEASNLLAVDIDAKHPEAKSWWSENRDGLPTTRVHRTRSGGLHLLFRHVRGLKCSAGKLAPGVDVRNDGGYVIWWPAAGMPVLCEGPIAELPTWLHRALLPLPRPKVVTIRFRGGHHSDRRALRGLIRTVATSSEGERNRITFWAACRAAEMLADGSLSESEAIAELAAAAVYAGLPEQEAIRTIRSGLRAERGSA
jgi:hypothetical protein